MDLQTGKRLRLHFLFISVLFLSVTKNFHFITMNFKSCKRLKLNFSSISIDPAPVSWIKVVGIDHKPMLFFTSVINE